MTDTREKLEEALVRAALNLLQEMGAASCVVPIPNSSLYVFAGTRADIGVLAAPDSPTEE